MTLVTTDNPTALAKRAFFLAWTACGGPLGMGAFQDKPGATEADVFRCIVGAEDYPEGSDEHFNKGASLYGDYVFGRMMKMGLKITDQGVDHREGELRADYEAWCLQYPTYEALLAAAQESLQAELN